MRALRRALLALGLAVVVLVLWQLRGHGGRPPTRGAWRQLETSGLDGERPRR